MREVYGYEVVVMVAVRVYGRVCLLGYHTCRPNDGVCGVLPRDLLAGAPAGCTTCALV